MKQFISKFSGVALGWAALSVMLFSFYPIGGEGYTIRMGNRLLIEQHVTAKATVPSLSLQQSDAAEELSIYYSHCGQIGTSRSLSIRDAKSKVLKEWKYMDASNQHTPMVCKVKDILALQRERGSVVELVYSSKELPDGKVLASVTVAGERVVAGR